MKYVYKILNFYGHRRNAVLLALSLIGSILFPMHYWIYAYLYFQFVYYPIAATTHHEFLAHEYIKPKNQMLEWVLLFYFIAHVFTSLKHKKGYHILHHKYENTDRDPTTIKINSCSTVEYMLDLGPEKELGINLDMPNLVTSDVRDWFNRHWLKIAIGTQIVWLVFFPLWTWFVFYIYPLTISGLSSRFVDIYYHKYNKKDFPPMALMLSTAGWHQTHHRRWRDYYMGEGPWMLVNTQYYAAKLLFTPTKITLT